MTEERWAAFVAESPGTGDPAVDLWAIDWHTLADEERIVISPHDDLVMHDLEGECACGPYIEHLGGRDWLYVHHSLDDRECLEGG